MNTEDQSAVIDFLASPATHGGGAVERIDTHTSVVFLAGPRAYKLKRAVRFDYVDFSTIDRRHLMCDAEVRLNRRTAPTLYRRALAVTRTADESYVLDGSGPAADWVVEMNRFPQEALFDRLASAQRLDVGLMAPLADAVAALHTAAERRDDHGGAAGMAWVIDGNAAGFAEFGKFLDRSLADRVTMLARAALKRQAPLLDARRASGEVRQCHGDLHLRNIVLLDGWPTLFDGVEFNDEISCIDVLYDLAFLLMDLWRRRLPRHANAVWNRYLAVREDLGGLPLLPLFLSCRAAVRAKTSATAARLERDAGRQATLSELSREYLELAAQLIAPAGPSLVAIGGLSGSGKSTLALGLAPSIGAAPGAIVFRSDEIRKRLAGVSPLDRLEADAYSSGVSAEVYRTLAARAALTVRAGQAAIVDAVYARAADRQVIEETAAAASVPFVGLWLDAPEPVRLARADARRHDVSDADEAVVRQQSANDTGEIRWRRIEGSAPPEAVRAQAQAALGETIGAALKQA